ncbi:zinc finger, CCHC-type containing protein [Tanacetum coccineum]
MFSRQKPSSSSTCCNVVSPLDLDSIENYVDEKVKDKVPDFLLLTLMFIRYMAVALDFLHEHGSPLLLYVTSESKDLDSNKGVRIDGNSNLSGIISKEPSIKSQAGLRKEERHIPGIRGYEHKKKKSDHNRHLSRRTKPPDKRRREDPKEKNSKRRTPHTQRERGGQNKRDTQGDMTKESGESSKKEISTPSTPQFQMSMRKNPTNYLIGQFRMQIILEANGLWEMIEPSETTQSDNKKDKTAIAFLYQSLPEEQLLQITKHKTAKAIWDALKTRHIGKERVQQASLGHTMEEETLVRKLLNAVPDRYLQIVASIERYSDLDEMTLEEAIGKYFRGRGRGKHKFSQGRNHENFMEQRKDEENSHKNYNRDNFKKSSYDTSKLQCYKCKKIGHIAPKCSQRTKPNEQSNLVEEDLEPTLLMAILEDEEQNVLLHEEDAGYKETNMDSLCRAPFPKKAKARSTLPLDLVYGDLCEPITPPTPSGKKYIFLLVDDYSRYMWVYFLSMKDQAFDTFKEFKKSIENELRTTLKMLRTDRGGEFTSNEFMQYYKQNGIARQLTALYSPQQNGVVERRNRTTMSATRFTKKGDDGKVYRLIKALYDLRQAPRAWNIKLDNTLKSLDFKKCALEQAIYTKKSKDSLLLVGVYVDDLIITGTPKKEIDKFKAQMEEKFEMSDLGLLAYYLGIEVTQTKGDISIKQSAYANKILKEAGMLESNETVIPMEPPKPPKRLTKNNRMGGWNI